MTGRTDVKQQLQNTGGQGDDADMWREQKELARSIMLAEDRIRKLKMVAGYQANNEDTKVDSLIIKWRSASREALIAFRDAIGAIFMSDDPQIGNTGWGYEDFNNGNNTNQNRMMKAGADNEYIIPEEPRVPNLKELCEKLKLDVEAFGTYDEDHDEFYG
ncbi:hypothetical protein DFJ77DRAFT_239198 [Powellomyces hirtus]|nr:hypothetical protein DFJ77DRAFT_239198 [Powellomyces hirtus]